MRQRLRPCRRDRRSHEGRGGDGGVVDDAVDHHLGDLVAHLDVVDRHTGELPGQLILAGQVLITAVHAYGEFIHASTVPEPSARGRERLDPLARA